MYCICWFPFRKRLLRETLTFPRRLVFPTPDEPITTNLTVGMSFVVVAASVGRACGRRGELSSDGQKSRDDCAQPRVKGKDRRESPFLL